MVVPGGEVALASATCTPDGCKEANAGPLCSDSVDELTVMSIWTPCSVQLTAELFQHNVDHFHIRVHDHDQLLKRNTMASKPKCKIFEKPVLFLSGRQGWSSFRQLEAITSLGSHPVSLIPWNQSNAMTRYGRRGDLG